MKDGLKKRKPENILNHESVPKDNTFTYTEDMAGRDDRLIQTLYFFYAESKCGVYEQWTTGRNFIRHYSMLSNNILDYDMPKNWEIL